MIEVYQMPDELFEFAAFANTQDLIDLVKMNRDKYRLVATVKTTKLDEAYTLTNSIYDHWSRNKAVKAIDRESRSTSVGDLLVSKRQQWLVCTYGFIDLTPLIPATSH